MAGYRAHSDLCLADRSNAHVSLSGNVARLVVVPERRRMVDWNGIFVVDADLLLLPPANF